MTTAEILESLTDRSRFELLATSVLRRADPRYASIIHTGINAKGETIVSPIDGVHRIPYSNPPHYVFVQHTTVDRKDLRGKWLSDEKGDLTKAAAFAKQVRHEQPQAVFTAVLTSNQRVEPQLFIDVELRAEAEQVSVDIWEQSRLADFLDSTVDGHWLRKMHLGIEAERLSVDLLRQLGWESLKRYRQEMTLLQGPLVHRSLIDDILANALPGGPTVCLVSGWSGYGKSVATAQALDQWLSSGSLGLWLPASFLREGVSLESAIDAWLRLLYPSLQQDVGRAAMELLGQAGRLLLCIDDINRTPDPARLLRRTIGLAGLPPSNGGQAKASQGEPRPASLVYQVLPIWPELLSSLPQKLLEQPWFRTSGLPSRLSTPRV
jgi:hypothetical protein